MANLMNKLRRVTPRAQKDKGAALPKGGGIFPLPVGQFLAIANAPKFNPFRPFACYPHLRQEPRVHANPNN